MKRLSLFALLAVGLFFIVGFLRFAEISFAAPPSSPELRWYQPFHAHPPVQSMPVPHGYTIHANGGIAYPLSAAAVDSGNVEYAVAPRASTQILPTERIPVMRSRSGRYYTIAPTITTETIETAEPDADSYSADSLPTLAPPLQTQQLQPPQTIQKSRQQIPAPSLNRSLNTNSEKNIPQTTTEYAPQLDELNARLAKMQLEKRNLEGTLRSIDKIEDVVFKVQTLVDLAEYVSRDQNYKKEADYLLDLALTATDAFLKNQPVIITFPNSPATSNATSNATKTIKPTKTITRPTLSESPESKPIDEPPKKTIDDDLENYLLLDPKPNTTADKTDKIENVEPKPDDKPSPTERARTNEIIDDNNSDLQLDANPLNDKSATAPSTTDKPKKPAIADVEVDPDVEDSLIVPSRPKKERPPLFAPDSRPTLDGSTPNDATEKSRTLQPSTINLRSKDGTTIKLEDTTVMPFEEYKKLNQPTPNAAAAAAENKTDTTKDPTESLKTPDQDNEKKKPPRPKRKPLIPSN